MAEKGSQKLQFPKESCKSRASRHQSVKIVHIQNPTMVTATVSQFREVVEFYTGKGKRSYTDHDESNHIKAPKLEGISESNFSPIREKPEIASMSNDRNKKNEDCGINSQKFKDVEAQSNEDSDIVNSEIFDALESIGDELYFGQFSPHLLYDQCN